MVRLSITHFETETFNDYLSIYDGNSTKSRLLGSLEGLAYYYTLYQMVFDSTQLFVLVHFRSDNNNQFRGFKVTYGTIAGKS